MLIPELDKLRDKKLSFGCVLELTEEYRSWFITLPKWENVLYAWFENKYWTVIKIDKVGDNPQWMIKYKILWHPLTRWRIEHYYRNNGTDYKYTLIYIQIHTRFENSRKTAYNQSELERMQHEKRPELKELLIQFSNYL